MVKMFGLNILVGLAACLSLESIAAKSLTGLKDQVFMITGPRGSKNLLNRQVRSVKSSITSMHVTSVIRARLCKVTTVSEMENTQDEAKEVAFSVRLPETAFISEFSMLVDGETFVGKVKEKALAEEEYKRAKAKGNFAGLVSAKVRETQTFNVAANVPAHSSIKFTLVYQELLKRKLGIYKHNIFVNPSQIVDDFVVNVYITEQIGITTVEAETPRNVNSEVAVATHVRRSKHQAKVTFKPTPTQQRRLLTIPDDKRKVTVVYDVTRENVGGDILTRDGYFVHYFAPQDLPVLPKKIVFVIDRSGSMVGTKMAQTKSAFETVLKDMGDADEFNIVDFAGDVKVWKPDQLVRVTEENVQEAISYVKKIVASGSTNLNNGIMIGAKLLDQVKHDDAVSSAIITLTDGDPTAGVTNKERIRANVKQAVGGRFSVFCIGFGKHLKYDFLKRLADENDGMTRKIYEDSDANLQLEGFFQEVATPLLLRVKMTYSGSKTSGVSKINHEKYFGGSEVIVVGAKLEEDKILKSRITGTSANGELVYNVVSQEVDETFRHWYEDAGDFSDFIERIWAYFTINELLEKKVLVDSNEEIKSIVKNITDLALKYKFVTPMTSMVVVQASDEITTTPSTSTLIPPIPPCYMRGSSVPDDIIKPIWCPYIFEKQDQNRQPQESMSLGRVVSPRRRFGAPARGSNSYMLTSAKILLPSKSPFRNTQQKVSPRRRLGAPMLTSAKIRRPSIPRGPIRNMASYIPTGPMRSLPRLGTQSIPADAMQSFLRRKLMNIRRLRLNSDRTRDRISFPKPPEKADNCSGVLTEAVGNIASPAPHHADNTVYCEWDISLPEDSWIDLYIVNLDTTKNKVVVSSNGKEIVKHQGGVGEFKYFSVMDNTVHVKMTIYPDDTKQPGIEIAYAEFVPDVSTSPTEDTMMVIDSPNCGHNITSEDNQSGYITSPDYPLEYSANVKCLWTLINHDTESLKLVLRVLDMDIEIDGDGACGHDRMVVFTGGQEPKQLCGLHAGEPFGSNEETTKIAFLSDDDLESGGFKLSYEFVTK